ncbi:MAG TPA: cytochrome P450 [Acidimicrobiales bacterium]|jgi:cholest-4-en-3-one 26-monooxygenase|nr:cytochrome P450 [Acidimicrobiales bacterium]
MTLITLDQIDLLEDTWARGVPHDQFAVLRREAPVYWHEHPNARGFWAITKHADVKAVSHDAATFSTEVGSAFILDQDPSALEFHRMTLLQMDPPKHNRYRRLVSAGFTPRMISMLADSIATRARTIVESIEGRDEIEFTLDIAAELPMQAICEMIGIPEEDRHRATALANRLVGAQDPDFQSSEEDSQLASAELYALCDELAADRRKNPRDDIMSILVGAEVDGDRLTDTELNLFFVLLVVAGNETTRNLIAHAMLALIERPDARAELVAGIDDDALWATAVEEMLRWGVSIQNFRRTVTHDTEIRGVPIKEGDKVVTFYASANRDEDVFEDSMTFDIRRTPNDHVTFGGGGVHFCLGANLARLEIKWIMREMLRRYPNPELAGEVLRLRSDFVNGIKYMPLRLNG